MLSHFSQFQYLQSLDPYRSIQSLCETTVGIQLISVESVFAEGHTSHRKRPEILFENALPQMQHKINILQRSTRQIQSQIAPVSKSFYRFSTCIQNLQRINPYCLRRHSKNLKTTRSKTNVRKIFFSCRIVETWNRLPERIVSSQTLFSFKSQLHLYNLDEVFEFDY